ncbi:MAG: hypothetical protein Q7S33_01510 [Nanoarchaeota archaeon]|nr:hypothetical protein [Nanoarchaeota archaeon]
MGDKRLEELSEEIGKIDYQRIFLDAQIRKRKMEIAKENGEAVDSIEKLVCDKHFGAHFKIIRQIPNSYTYKNDKRSELNIYHCGPCEEDAKIWDKSKAYDCPTCGVVKGDFVRKPYRSDEESWKALAGREGEHYHCRICDTQLGYQYYKFS